ncbi:hypothetical protein EZS27_014731 [termite gut metagenome]|uniref:Uncharacterized protein n=1 Tax=termite gut metagenome TaxID=433724 RepID=A0A5J4RU54_9ZZZZ
MYVWIFETYGFAYDWIILYKRNLIEILINTEAQRHGESTNSVPLSLCVKTNLDYTILTAIWYEYGKGYEEAKTAKTVKT